MAEYPSERVARTLWDGGLHMPGGNLLNELHLNGSKAVLVFQRGVSLKCSLHFTMLFFPHLCKLRQTALLRLSPVLLKLVR